MAGGVKVVLEVPLLKPQGFVACDLPQPLQLGQNLFPFQVLQLLELFLLLGFLLRVAGRGERGSVGSPCTVGRPPPPGTPTLTLLFRSRVSSLLSFLRSSLQRTEDAMLRG